MAHFKLMIDEEYWSLAPYLNGISNNVEAKTTKDCGFAPSTRDSALIGATAALNRILLTRDRNTINRRRYMPCTHGGIIVLRANRLRESQVRNLIKLFCLSGIRQHCVGHFTYLSKDHAVIHTHKEIITVKWHGKKPTYSVETVPLNQARNRTSKVAL